MNRESHIGLFHVTKRPIKPRYNDIDRAIESLSLNSNIVVKLVSFDNNSRIWRIASGSSVSVEITIVEIDDKITTLVTPIAFMGDYEIFMPSDLTFTGDIGSFLTKMETFIVLGIDRADTLLEVLSSIRGLLSKEYSGKMREMPPSQNNDKLYFTYAMAEDYLDQLFLTEITLIAEECGFSLIVKSKGVNDKTFNMDLCVISCSRSCKEIIDATLLSIERARESYSISANAQTSDAYRMLKRDPNAFDGKVVLFTPRQKY